MSRKGESSSGDGKKKLRGRDRRVFIFEKIAKGIEAKEKFI